MAWCFYAALNFSSFTVSTTKLSIKLGLRCPFGLACLTLTRLFSDQIAGFCAFCTACAVKCKTLSCLAMYYSFFTHLPQYGRQSVTFWWSQGFSATLLMIVQSRSSRGRTRVWLPKSRLDDSHAVGKYSKCCLCVILWGASHLVQLGRYWCTSWIRSFYLWLVLKVVALVEPHQPSHSRKFFSSYS